MKAKRAMSAALLTLLGAGFAVKAGDDLYFKPGRNFPENIRTVEAKYGPFKRKPHLALENLRFGYSGGIHPIYSDTIVINSNPINNAFEYVAGPFFGVPNRDYTVKHELAHLVIKKILEDLWVAGIRPKREAIGEFHPLQLVAQSARNGNLEEGIADYIANQMFGSGGSSLYKAQFDFVKPIMDRFGVKKGIEKLITERPTAEELQIPQKYYERLGLSAAK